MQIFTSITNDSRSFTHGDGNDCLLEQILRLAFDEINDDIKWGVRKSFYGICYS